MSSRRANNTTKISFLCCISLCVPFHYLPPSPLLGDVPATPSPTSEHPEGEAPARENKENGRVAESHDTSRCRTTPLSYDTSSEGCRRDTNVVRHLGSVERHHRRHDTSGPCVRRTNDTTVVTTLGVRRTTPPSHDTWGPSYDTTVVRHLQVSYGGLPESCDELFDHQQITNDPWLLNSRCTKAKRNRTTPAAMVAAIVRTVPGVRKFT